MPAAAVRTYMPTLMCRISAPKLQYEPRSFITLIDFLLLDEDDNYFVTEEQIVELMTTRYDYDISDPVVLAMVHGAQWRNGGEVSLQLTRESETGHHIDYMEFVRRWGAAIRKQRSQHRHKCTRFDPSTLTNIQRSCKGSA